MPNIKTTQTQKTASISKITLLKKTGQNVKSSVRTAGLITQFRFFLQTSNFIA